MKLERLLELAQTATPPFQPSPDLLALLRESLSKSLSENALTKYYPLLSEYRKELITFASSEFTKHRKKIRSVKEVSKTLTIGQIRDLLTFNWIRQLHPQRPNEPLNYADFVHRQLLALFFATQLQHLLRNEFQEEISLAVLLAHIYQPLLSRFDPDTLLRFQQMPRDNRSVHSRAGEFTAAELTESLLNQWGLPQRFTERVRLLLTPKATGSDKETSRFLGVGRLALYLAQWCQQDGAVTFQDLQQISQQASLLKPQELFDQLKTALQRWPLFAQAMGYHLPSSPNPLAILLKDPSVVQQKLIPYEELAAAYLGLLENCQTPATESEPATPSFEVQFMDKTTGVYNHTYFHLSLQSLIAQASRYEFPISLIMLDVDAFKLLNEVHGHLVGDAILTQMAALLKGKLRKADIICRTGADEFGIILSHTGRLHAHHVAEKIRRAIEQHTFYHPTQDRTYPVTVSIAYAAFTPEVSIVQKNQLLEITRRALIRAKIRGGNQCLEGHL